MRLIIHDANVLIDLIDIGLLDRALELPFAMETTDFIRLEVQTPKQAYALSECIRIGSLSVVSSSIVQLAAIGAFQEENPQLSIADCSVVFHALDRSGIVFSGDGRLRREAEARKLEVRGTPWVLGLMVEHHLLDSDTAIEKLEYLLSINRRLPQKECSKLIDFWKKR
ncbi:MAG: hypothetical protein E4G89_06015 [Methanothrix sp.]|nr:MAG: hypothetical protein E4G89_06015 [Methanothrix sp.]